jgi:predicted  nucleic acid-binding Zn-ribbon protein
MGLIDITIVSDKHELKLLRRAIMALSEQVQQMRQAQADMKAAIVSAAERVSTALQAMESRIATLGEPDPDLTRDIQELHDATDALNSLAKEAPVTPAPEPEPEPSPVEQ